MCIDIFRAIVNIENELSSDIVVDDFNSIFGVSVSSFAYILFIEGIAKISCSYLKPDWGSTSLKMTAK